MPQRPPRVPSIPNTPLPPPKQPKTLAEQLGCPDSFKQVTGLCCFFGTLTYYSDVQRRCIAVRSVKHKGAFVIFRAVPNSKQPRVAFSDLEQHLRQGNDGVVYVPARARMTLPLQFTKRFFSLPGEHIVCPLRLVLDQADFSDDPQKRDEQYAAAAKFLVGDGAPDIGKLTEFADRNAMSFKRWNIAFGQSFDKILLVMVEAKNLQLQEYLKQTKTALARVSTPAVCAPAPPALIPEPPISPGHDAWHEYTGRKTALIVDPDKFGAHNYGDEDGTSDCEYGCGCWMGPCRSGGPVNPFGACPENPISKTPPPAPGVGEENSDAH